MNLSRLFILRPVATTLSMLAIVLAGLMAYKMLPVAALPQVDYPTIRVMTLYPGASPQVMTSAVTAPLERQFGQMPGLTQMASTSSGGASVLTLRFSLDMNMDVAEQQVQAAINAASNLLPNDLPAPPVYNKVNPADTLKGVVMAPSAAIQFGTNGTFVYAVDSANKAQIRALKVGASDGDLTVIEDGLAVGDRVVLEGTDRLKEGSDVEVVNDSSEVPTTPTEHLQGKPASTTAAPAADGKARKVGP